MIFCIRALLLVLTSIILTLREGECSGVSVENIALGALNTGSTTVSFNITWTNSWRSTGSGAPAPNNWDAAWIFVKFRKNGGDWAHASLNNSGHSSGSGTAATIAVGYPGDNATSNSSFKQGSSDNDPWYIGSEAAITTANIAGSGTGTAETAAEYYYVTDFYANDDATGAAFTIPADFPKGYQAYYMMKGEISQGQWVAFFNTLTATQKTTLDITAATGKNSDNITLRNNVSWTGSGSATLPDRGGGATYAAVAVNYLSWADLTAYLDWSGLRPMSELEFERAGRGPYRVVSGEYAWGSTSITQATSISNAGLPNERAQSGANAAFGGHASVQGPVRVGSFAYGVATRIAAGAGYYGAMELSGNVWERPVTVGNSTGRSFAGRYHGNGSLDSNGNAEVTTWPGTNAIGGCLRGNSYSADITYSRISDRINGGRAHSTRSFATGGRGVRVAP